MISKKVIDLLDDEEELEIPDAKPKIQIDDIFATGDNNNDSKSKEQERKVKLSTKDKLHILSWNFINKQLSSYGLNRLNSFVINLMKDEDKKRIIEMKPDMEFDFRSESIPFAVKYNIAIALSYAEAIEILSNAETCEIYSSEEVKRVFKKYGFSIANGLNNINFKDFPIDMKKELIWPMTQNLYRALTVRRAAQIFPEGVSGKIACEALMSELENDELSSRLSNLSSLEYSDYETVYFSDLSDLEIKYHIASYCLENIGKIKKTQKPEKEKPENENKKVIDNIENIEDEYIAAFKRLNKNKSFWDKINLENLLEMGKDVLTAIQEEVKNFSKLKQEIKYRLAGNSKVAIEDDELIRIARGLNPNFELASRYFDMFFQPSDYYSILGLNNNRNITEKEVKDAFKRLAKIYHPDKNPNDPLKKEKELRFKLLIEAKDAILKKLKSKGEPIEKFRNDVALINYLGSISKLFDGYSKDEFQCQKMDDENIFKQEKTEMEDKNKNIENLGSELMDGEKYLGPYFEEMHFLESLIDNWKGKEILVLGVGRKPEDFSIPVILSQIGAKVFAVDVDYSGPAEYKGCIYYRASIDRVDIVFEDKKFDIVISTSVFGVPLTNWAIRQYSLNPFNEFFYKRIMQLELEILEKLAKLTKDGGLHLHYNKDMNPQSWRFTEEDLLKIGYKSAFHPEGLTEPQKTWILKV